MNKIVLFKVKVVIYFLIVQKPNILIMMHAHFSSYRLKKSGVRFPKASLANSGC